MIAAVTLPAHDAHAALRHERYCDVGEPEWTLIDGRWVRILGDEESDGRWCGDDRDGRSWDRDGRGRDHDGRGRDGRGRDERRGRDQGPRPIRTVRLPRPA